MNRLASVELYTLQIVSDQPLEKLDRDRVAAAVREAEENLTDLLQPGYRAVIRPWDHDEEETDESEAAAFDHYHDWVDAYGSVGAYTVQQCRECLEYQTIHTSGRITKGETRR